jgi:t-SNARE complex subunit (syntaxin)
MLDRLNEVYGDGQPNVKIQIEKKEEDQNAEQDQEEKKQQKHEDDYLTEYTKALRDKTNEITVNIQLINDLTHKISKSVIVTERDQLIKQIHLTGDKINDQAIITKTLLAKPNPPNCTNIMQSKLNNIRQLHKEKFLQLMSDYKAAAANSNSKIDGIAKRQLKLFNVEDQNIDKIMESGHAFETIQQLSISDNVQDVVDEILSRHTRILNLERSIIQINELMKDIASLVDEQGEVLDSVGTHIEKTKTNVEKGEVHLIKARVEDKKARKKLHWIFCCCFIVLIAILGPVWFFSLRNA